MRMEQKAAKVASETEKAVDGPGIRVEARIGGGGAVCVCPFRLLSGRSQRRVRIRFKDFFGREVCSEDRRRPAELARKG